MSLFDQLSHDLRCAIRNLRRYPVATIIAIASLAAGIGAAAITLTVRSALFLKPPAAYQQPGQLSRVQVGRTDRPIRALGSPVPAGLFDIWSQTLGSTLGASTTAGGDRDVRTDDRTETVPVRAVTPELFSVLGVGPSLGRSFSSQQPGDAGSVPAVLSHRAWQRLFDGRPDVIGRTVWIDDRPHAVIGVMPERFWVSAMDSPIWTMLDRRMLAPDAAVDVVVRRPRGVTPAMLDAQLQPGLAAYARRRPAGERRLLLKVSGVEGTPLGHEVAIALPYVLGASVLLTLLIACANVAILMIAQWTAREHEIAIRASIGASRGRIVRSLLAESVLVALLSGMLGVFVTFTLRAWIAQSGGTVAFMDLSIDSFVLAQVVAVALLAGIAAGIGPALYETRRLHVNPLRRIAGLDKVRQRWRHALVVSEITVTVALLVQTIAMVAGYQRARHTPMGYPTRPLMTARVENPGGVPTARVLEVMTRLPGVAAASASTAVPFASIGPRPSVAADAAGSGAVAAEQATISAGFFSTLGVPMRAGRQFSREDSALSRRAIVNEALAKRVFQGRRALDSQIWIGQTPFDIVGVVADYSTNPMRVAADEPKVFLPLGPDAAGPGQLLFLIRADGDPSALVQAVRREVRGVTAGTVVTSAWTVDQIVNVMGQEILAGVAPLVPLAAIGMTLTMAGIYGVLAFAIARRTRELALRVAVGASGTDLVRLVATQTLRLVTVGCGIGIALTYALARVVRAGGGAGSVFDPPAYAFVVPVLVILVIGLLATWIPSRRAATIDPAVLLRTN
jgi:predicted permease